MKKLLVGLIVAGLMLGIVPQSQAINKEWSAVLGFVGGVLVADSYRHHHAPVYCVERPIYYEPMYCPPCSPGYWVEVVQRRWVPGYWITEYDSCCRCDRQTWIEGYWISVPVRVYRPCPRCGR